MMTKSLLSRDGDDLNDFKESRALEMMGVEVPYNPITSWDGDVDKLIDAIDFTMNRIACDF